MQKISFQIVMLAYAALFYATFHFEENARRGFAAAPTIYARA